MANELLNQKITVIVKANGVADTAGNTLAADYSFCYYSCFCPYYSTVKLVRLRGGMFLNGVSDEVIALAILDASLETDLWIQSLCVGGIKPDNLTLFYAKISYVTNLVLLNLLAAVFDRFGAGKSKRLADLSIGQDNSAALKDRLKKLHDDQNDLRRYLLTCGEMGKGTSVKPRIAVKGGYRTDEPWIGRDWSGTGPLNAQETAIFVDITKNRPKRYFMPI